MCVFSICDGNVIVFLCRYIESSMAYGYGSIPKLTTIK